MTFDTFEVLYEDGFGMTGQYKQGDYVKVGVRDDTTNESEWMWVLVDHSDDEQRVVFGRLDNKPVVHTNMRLGMELAVSYDNIRDHRTAGSFSAPDPSRSVQ